MNFFRSFLASLLGTFVALGILCFFSFISIIGIVAVFSNKSTEKEKINIKPNTVFKLRLDRPIVEKSSSLNSFEEILKIDSEVLSLDKILTTIDFAKNQENINGISLEISPFLSVGWTQIRSIRSALEKFKESGKFVYAYSDILLQKGYYLSSVADSIFVNPMGSVELKGLAANVLYYKNFEDKYGVKMDVIRSGAYKSAVEPYLESKMSDKNRLQLKELLGSLWETVENDIAKSRNISVTSVNQIAENILTVDLEKALDLGVIDGLVSEKQYKNKLNPSKNTNYNNITLSKLYGISKSSIQTFNDKIAIIYAQGSILYSNNENESIIGKKLFIKTIRKAAKNKKVKAIVLRINSPGGDALTSDILWNEIEDAKKKKPVIVSMGDVAASGGYYIAAGADKIFADPMSVTGSIGVFAAIPNVSGFTQNIGINSEEVVTHSNANGYNPFKSDNRKFKAIAKKEINKIYATFKKRVSMGRNLEMNYVEKNAQGRVWSGKDALNNKLVDTLGDLSNAIEYAAKKVNIKEYNVISYPKLEPSVKNILDQLSPFVSIEVPKFLQKLNFIEKPESTKLKVYTSMPYELEIN